jgi:hypothetical protein
MLGVEDEYSVEEFSTETCRCRKLRPCRSSGVVVLVKDACTARQYGWPVRWWLRYAAGVCQHGQRGCFEVSIATRSRSETGAATVPGPARTAVNCRRRTRPVQGFLCFRRSAECVDNPGGQGVAGSNPVVPTGGGACWFEGNPRSAGFLCCWCRFCVMVYCGLSGDRLGAAGAKQESIMKVFDWAP